MRSCLYGQRKEREVPVGGVGGWGGASRWNLKAVKPEVTDGIHDIPENTLMTL
jgi:hypothetical protein